MQHSPFGDKSMKNKLIIVAIAILIISNLVFVCTTIFYKTKADSSVPKTALKDFKVYSFEGEDSNVKITNGLIIISPNKVIINGGEMQYVGKSNEKIVAYSKTIYLDKGEKKDQLVSTSVSLGVPNGISFSDEFSLNKGIGGVSYDKSSSKSTLQNITDNLYFSLDYVRANFEKGNFTVKLNVKEFNM